METQVYLDAQDIADKAIEFMSGYKKKYNGKVFSIAKTVAIDRAIAELGMEADSIYYDIVHVRELLDNY